MIKQTDKHLSTPKKYSRKITKEGFICTCECFIVAIGDLSSAYHDYIDKIQVKYEILPNKYLNRNIYDKPKGKYSYSSYIYSGKFKKMIELPNFFDKLDDNKYIINIAYFTRDGVEVPFVYSIEIDKNEYLLLKNKEERRKKLNKIKNL